MKIKINKIYRWGNNLVRVADVKGDVVEMSNGGYADINDIHPALPVGAVLYSKRYPYGSSKIWSEIESLDEETKIDGVPFFDGAGNERHQVVFPDTKEIGDEKLGEVCEFLESARYDHSPLAVAQILGEWRRNKERLRRTLSLSPVWNEEAMGLVFHIEVPDSIKEDEAKGVFSSIMLAYYDEFPYSYCHSIKFDFEEFLNIEDNSAFKSANIKIARGMKPSRAIRRYFEAIGAHRIEDFERMYARLSDALSDRMLKRTLVLSIHPMDYLRMSYGNSWKSCHHIGERGCYHAGTLSYLMDESSMVATLLPTEFKGKTYEQAKINRMMFFLNEEGDILQSRLYPQTRIPELETILAKEVAAKIKECLKIEGEYKAVVEDTACDRYVWSIGQHYHDYNCDNYGQRIWSVRTTPKQFKIGHAGVCICSGELNTSRGHLIVNHDRVVQKIKYRCPNSGKEFKNKDCATLNPADGKYYKEYYTCPECGATHFDKNEVYCPECRKTHKMVCDCGSEEIYLVYQGKAYCKDCAARELAFCEDCGEVENRQRLTECDNRLLCEDCMEQYEDMERCEDCGEYHDRDDMVYVEDFGWICQSCYENGGYYRCDHCDRIYQGGDMTRVDDYDVCPDCLDRYYYRCEECGEYVCEGDAIEINDNYYCPDCVDEYFVRCEECDEYVHIDDATEVEGEYYCPDCFEDKCAVCADCGEAFFKSEMIKTEDGWICEECAEERAEREAESEKRLGVLNKTLDSRFEEGAEVFIEREFEHSYKVKLMANDKVSYRFVEKEYITERVSA